jgi:hypothetical protein
MESPVLYVDTTRARRLLAACGLTLVASMAVATIGSVDANAQAATPAQSGLFGVHPVQEGLTTLPGGHFNFALVPRQRITDGIVVVNLSSHALTFRVYGADLLTAVGGGLAPAQPTAVMRDVGLWITVSRPIVSIAAHGQTTDEFTLTVPAEASAGQHLGAVVAAADVGVTAQGAPLEARAALIAVVTLPGVVDASARLTALVGSAASSGQIQFRLMLANTGNVLLTYSGVLTIVDADGHRVAALSLRPSDAYVVPTGQVSLAAIWKLPAPPGSMYGAQARVTIFADGVAVRTLTSQSVALQFSSDLPAAFPVVVGLVGAMMLLLVAGMARSTMRRRRRSAIERPLGAAR